jgi:hypothetical protein
MVVSGEVQHAVEDENLYLGEQVVADFGGLGASGLERDGDVSASWRLAGKGEHVGGFVFVAELEVETLDFGVAREQDIYFAGEPCDALSLVRKTREGQAAQVFRFSAF